MTVLATLAVIGTPAPQGSKSIDSRSGRLIEGGSTSGRAKHAAWRAAVAWQARNTAGSNPPLDSPLHVVISFRLPMPKTRPALVRRDGACWHAVKPDIDKLIRSTLDGLTAGRLIADDARVVSITATAVEVTAWTGAVIQIHSVSGDDARRQALEADAAVEVWGLKP